MTNALERTVSGQEFWQWWQTARQQAAIANIPTAELEWLLQEVSGLSRLSLRSGAVRDWEKVPLKRSLDELTQLWQHRVEARVPVQYLAGVSHWRQFSLAVSPAVLIPRPETELLIDLAIAATDKAPKLKQGNWADLGTGSGAIALSLATALPQATVYAVDWSKEALAIAKTNAQHYKLANQIRFYQGSWFEPLAQLKGSFSGIVSNPPYIPSKMVAELQPEVAKHEPGLALDGGADGLDSVRHLIATAPDYLQPGGLWLIEMMVGQAKTVANLLHQQGSYRDIQIYSDLAGIERFALAFRGVAIPFHHMPSVSLAQLIDAACSGDRLISFPTDTVPALAVRPDRAELIFAAKQRSQTKPLILMGAKSADLWQFVAGSAEEKQIWQQVADRYWPGALTLVLPASPNLPVAVNPTDPTTVGIRVPNCAIARHILAQTAPLATTSVNRSSQPPLQTLTDIAVQFPEVLTLSPSELDMRSTLQPQDGASDTASTPSAGVPSTVIRWRGNAWEVLRQGKIQLNGEEFIPPG